MLLLSYLAQKQTESKARCLQNTQLVSTYPEMEPQSTDLYEQAFMISQCTVLFKNSCTYADSLQTGHYLELCPFLF